MMEEHDDPQKDPEYNLLQDEEMKKNILCDIQEEMRGDRSVKIPKKECKQLIYDSYDIFDQFFYDEPACVRK